MVPFLIVPAIIDAGRCYISLVRWAPPLEYKESEFSTPGQLSTVRRTIMASKCHSSADTCALSRAISRSSVLLQVRTTIQTVRPPTSKNHEVMAFSHWDRSLQMGMYHHCSEMESVTNEAWTIFWFPRQWTSVRF